MPKTGDSTTNRHEKPVIGVHIEWLDDETADTQESAVYFRINMMTEKALDAWVKRTAEIAAEKTEPIRFIYHITVPMIAITPPVRERIRQVLDQHPHGREGRVAVVLPEATAGRLVKLFIDRQVKPNTLQEGVEHRVFFELKAAKAWVMESDD